MSTTNGERMVFDRKAMEAAQLVHNELLSRAGAFQKLLGCKKDIEGECGHPETITAEEFRASYDRDPVGRRVVELFPRETWKIQPTVFEDENPDRATPFEQAWDDLSQQLNGGSLFQTEGGSPVWEFIERVDVLSGIGHYGVLLLGFDDGEDLMQEVETRDGRQLLFLRAFDESLAQISTYETDESSPRFGQPTSYMLFFNDTLNETITSFGLPLSTKQVHWSRVIHVADNLASSEIFGQPRQRVVWNRLCDLRKLYGGSAEMYWKGAFPGISIESHPNMAGDVEFDSDEMKDQMEDYYAGLKRYLALSGFSANSIAPQVVDPTPQIERQLEAISLTLGIPNQILIGNQVGELRAATESRMEWNGRLQSRRTGYVTPRLIVPFIDRLIATGVLPRPSGYSVMWPEPETLMPSEQAEIAAKRTEAISKYVQSGIEALIPPMDYLTRELGYTDEEAQSVIGEAMRADRMLEDLMPQADVSDKPEDEDESDESED